MLEELEFTGEIKKQRCSICKLRLKKEEEVLSCPQCESLFHKEHLIRWLKEFPECPVCVHDFSDIVKKYSDLLIKEKREQMLTALQSPERYTITNPKSASPIIFIRIVLTLFGLVFGFVPNIIFNLTIDWEAALYFNWFFYIFSMVGFAMIYFGNTRIKDDITNQWKIMIFTQDKILINSEGLISLEIWKEDIINIELKQGVHRDENRPREYYVSLKLYTIKDKKYDFSDIITSRDEHIALRKYHELRQRISKYYGIITDTSRKSFTEHLNQGIINNWRFILIASIIHLVISATCILINYYG